MMDLAEAAAKFAEIGLAEAIALHEGLDRAAACVEKRAKAEIGTYQPAVGEFPEWPELAPSTQSERERKGFTPNDPLLRTGELRDSISHETHGLEAVIGSTSDIMIYQELGTVMNGKVHVPARPVLGPAVFQEKETIERLIGAAAVGGIIGMNRIHAALGYDFETK